jgi:hypothetical protein
MACHCPKCMGYGRRWDTEARALTCCYNPCRTITGIGDQRSAPRSTRLVPIQVQNAPAPLNMLPDGPMCPY